MNQRPMSDSGNRSDHWQQAAHSSRKYFEAQFDTIYRSTVLFADWLKGERVLDRKPQRVLDIGCGMGAATAYLATQFPDVSFTGIDLNAELIEAGRKRIAERGIANLSLEQGDLFQLSAMQQADCDGIISLQTLSWLPEAEPAIRSMLELKPGWFAASSLFFEGLVDCEIKVHHYAGADAVEKSRTDFYNIYSIPRISRLLNSLGYSVQFQRFDIDVDLPHANPSEMGTYTQRLESGRRLQISGPLLMCWYFFLAQIDR